MRLMYIAKTRRAEIPSGNAARGEQQFFKDRSVYYATFPIREQSQQENGIMS